MHLARGLRGLLLAAVSTATLTGCQGSGPPALDRTDLVSDLATRIESASNLEYFAEYQVAGGTVASVAQVTHPRRTAYRYAGGLLIIGPEGTTLCGGKPRTCATTAASPGGNPAHPVPELTKHGLIPPKLLSTLLTSAALDLAVGYRQTESTIAGQPATCVDVSGMSGPVTSAFEACVTTDGVIASFSGVVNGDIIELALTRYTRDLPADAFTSAAPDPRGALARTPTPPDDLGGRLAA